MCETGGANDNREQSKSGVSARLRRRLDDAAAVRDLDPTSARALALEVRVEARAIGDVGADAEAAYRLASIAHAAGDIDDAFGFALESAASAGVAGMPSVEAWATHLLAVVHYQAGNLTDALDHARRALEVYRIGEEDADEGNMLNTIAAVYHSMGDDERAIATYDAALAVAEPLGRHAFCALVLANIARIRASRAEHLVAVELGRRAVDLAQEHGPDIVSSLLADLAESYTGLADHASAATCFAGAREAWVEIDRSGDGQLTVAQLSVMLAEGRSALRRGALDEAIAVLQAARDIAEQTGHGDVELVVTDLLAGGFKRAGRFEEALEQRERHGTLSRGAAAAADELRVRTLRVAHEATTARHELELLRLAGSGGDGAGGRSEDHASPASRFAAFERLAVLAEFRDADRGHHTERVGDLAAELAHACGQPPEWCERLRLAARLHDVGKVAVPDHVLLKSGPLTVAEFDLMKTHTLVGHQILRGSPNPLFQLGAELALSHHEWWDGAGYPNGLDGTDIPVSGRIVALADVFDALCTRRPYKRAWTMGESARFVVSGSGAQFDPALVSAFVAVVTARHPDLRPHLA